MNKNILFLTQYHNKKGGITPWCLKFTNTVFQRFDPGHEQEDLPPLSPKGKFWFVPSWIPKPRNQDLQTQAILIYVNVLCSLNEKFLGPGKWCTECLFSK